MLGKSGISTEGGRGYHIFFRIAQEQVICFGSREGKQHTFALFEEWVPPHPGSRGRDQALQELATRYFISHGPATVQDFAWWSGLAMADARAGLEAASPRLEKAAVGKSVYWFPGHTAGVGPGAWLLPGFDEYLLGYKDRDAVLDPQHAEKIIPGGNGVFLPTVVLDGRVAGTWKRTIRKRGALVTVTPFRPLKKPAKASVQEAVEHYGGFLEMPVEVEFAGA